MRRKLVLVYSNISVYLLILMTISKVDSINYFFISEETTCTSLMQLRGGSVRIHTWVWLTPKPGLLCSHHTVFKPIQAPC
jgi:hypothetical protein